MFGIIECRNFLGLSVSRSDITLLLEGARIQDIDLNLVTAKKSGSCNCLSGV